MRLIAMILTLLPSAALADWAMRGGDTVFDAAALMARLDGQEVAFYDGGRSVYGPGDAYAYVYSDGRPVPGTYALRADGAVCVEFENGWSRCDLYVSNKGRMYLITEEGDRFPVKP